MLQKLGKGGNVAEIGVDEGKFSQKIFEINAPENYHLVDVWGTDRFHDGKYEAVKNYFQEQINNEQVHIHKSFQQMQLSISKTIISIGFISIPTIPTKLPATNFDFTLLK